MAAAAAAVLELVHCNTASPRLQVELTLVGGIAVEDKLQPGVAETVQCLMSAGIRFCMLTGDKRETVWPLLLLVVFGCWLLIGADHCAG